MMNNLADFKNAIPFNIKSIPENTLTKNNLELTEPKNKITTVVFKKNITNWRVKAVTDWNKKDIVRYWFDKYYDKFGTYPGNFSALPAQYQLLDGLSFMLSKAVKQEESILLVKYYIDWLFESDMIKSVVNSKLTTLHTIKKEKLMQNFASFFSQQTELTIKEKLGLLTIFDIEAAKSNQLKESLNDNISIKISEIDDAYHIHSQYFMENYGIIIPVIYLVNFKNKNITDAKKYITDSMNKINNKDLIERIKNATEKFGPYPKWVSEFYIDILNIKIDLVDQNDMFNELRRI